MDESLMCVRESCEVAGLPTSVKKCPNCGFRTQASDPQRAAALRNRHRLHFEEETPEILLVTTNDIAGYRITKVHGDVYGSTVMARNVFANWGASLRTVTGGEVVDYTEMLTESRHLARRRLLRQAAEIGANAVIAVRFDCNEIGDIMTEMLSYGTAVTVSPIEEPEPVEPVPAPGSAPI